MSDSHERLTPEAKKIIDLAYREALSHGQNAIAPAHIALALGREAQAEADELRWAYNKIASTHLPKEDGK
jgi:hypothetical protein